MSENLKFDTLDSWYCSLQSKFPKTNSSETIEIPQSFDDLYRMQLNSRRRERAVGFTVTPAAYNAIRHIIRQQELKFIEENPLSAKRLQESLVEKGQYILYGTAVIIVQTQREPILSWTDEKEMKEYIETEDAKLQANSR